MILCTTIQYHVSLLKKQIYIKYIHKIYLQPARGAFLLASFKKKSAPPKKNTKPPRCYLLATWLLLDLPRAFGLFDKVTKQLEAFGPTLLRGRRLFHGHELPGKQPLQRVSKTGEVGVQVAGEVGKKNFILELLDDIFGFHSKNLALSASLYVSIQLF